MPYFSLIEYINDSINVVKINDYIEEIEIPEMYKDWSSPEIYHQNLKIINKIL
ncbi:hypothetical protein HNQ94_000865 [Salirhabdus euzebyi]|uniref:Uncharacterized protein n=1 Tax=Salirhabdus euzebyi TaxID=394506 RepID=A0A841PUE1_9BACI|nr:hypothetical protein [Salirhabdus euzebyi]